MKIFNGLSAPSGLMGALIVAACAWGAEPPAGTASVAAPRAPIGGPSLDLAKEAVDTALAVCKAGNQTVSAVIIDESGLVKMSEAADGAAGGTPDVARRKAFTSLTFKADGIPLTAQIAADKALADKVAADPVNYWPRPRGARLIKVGDRIIGVIGVSGSVDKGPGAANDDDCAQAALQKIADRLK